MSFELIEVNMPFGKQWAYDVSGYVRSEDMRNMLKAGLPITDPDHVEQIILYSNLPMSKKAQELRKLAMYTRHLENSLEYQNMAEMLEMCLQQIFMPKERVLFIWQRTGEDRYLYYDSFEALMMEWNVHREREMDEDGCYKEILPSCDHVSQLFIGGDETVCRMGFTLQWIDGKYEIRAVQPNYRWLKEKGISEQVIHRYWCGLDLSSLGLKFPEGEHWKLRTPAMERKACGDFENSDDGKTVFFYAYDEKEGLTGYAFESLDVDYCGDMYSILDWLEREPEEEEYDIFESPPFD